MTRVCFHSVLTCVHTVEQNGKNMFDKLSGDVGLASSGKYDKWKVKFGATMIIKLIAQYKKVKSMVWSNLKIPSACVCKVEDIQQSETNGKLYYPMCSVL